MSAYIFSLVILIYQMHLNLLNIPTCVTDLPLCTLHSTVRLGEVSASFHSNYRKTILHQLQLQYYTAVKTTFEKNIFIYVLARLKILQ